MHGPVVHRIQARALTSGIQLSAQPTVITGLFEGQPIRKIATIEDACAQLGAMQIKTRSNYLEALFGGGPGPTSRDVRHESLSTFVAHSLDSHTPGRLCVEFHTPAELMSLFAYPTFCDAPQGWEPPISLLFVAGRGNVAHMHFDTDHRRVLLYQVFGRKRVVVLPPGCAKQLLPLSATSLLALHQWSDERKRDLFQYLGAVDVTLSPGEAIYIPPLWWHYVEYLDFGMSFSVRYSRSPLSRLIANHAFPDLFVQNVGFALCHGALANKAAAAIERIGHLLTGSYETPIARHHATRTLFEKLYVEMCPESFQGTYCVAPIDNIEQRLAIQFYERQMTRGTAASDRAEWRL